MKRYVLPFVFAISSNVLALNPFVATQDITAGESLPVQITGFTANEQLEISLIRPDKTSIDFQKITNDLGGARFHIDSMHVKKAGTYQLQIASEVFQNKIQKTFTVQSNQASAFRSKINLKKQVVAADGEEEAYFIIDLKDAFGNPVLNQAAKIFSSREEDIIIAEPSSNSRGQIQGRIKSKTPGQSKLSALIGETLISQRPEVIFYLTGTSRTNIGSDGAGSGGSTGNIGSLLKAQLFSDSFGDLAYFSIEQLPTTVTAGELQSVKISAKDENGTTIKNYVGRLRFSSSDNEAKLPSDYTFDREDQGAHTFSLAIVFKNIGSQTIAVHDLSDFRINGEQVVEVIRASGEAEEEFLEAAPKGNSIVITSPQPGPYSLLRATIVGKADGFDMVRLADGPTLLTDHLNVDPATGSFIYQTPPLAEGGHLFRATSTDETIISKELKIQVDRTGPSGLTVELIPEMAKEPGEEIQIKVTSNELLSSAHCGITDQVIELEDRGDHFLGTLTAPSPCGEYPIGCLVADKLGNETDQDAVNKLKVCEDKVKEDVEEEPKESAPSPPPPTEIPPTAVASLSAQSGDEKVTLFWSPAKDDQEISNYIIRFGPHPENLYQENLTPDNRTQWYVEDLEPGQKYYFQVIAIDNEGLEGPPSRVAEGITKGRKIMAENLDKTGSGGLPMQVYMLIGVLILGSGIIALRHRA